MLEKNRFEVKSNRWSPEAKNHAHDQVCPFAPSKGDDSARALRINLTLLLPPCGLLMTKTNPGSPRTLVVLLESEQQE
jgi:hypothetical protein